MRSPSTTTREKPPHSNYRKAPAATKAQHNQTHKEYVLTLTILSQFSKFHSVTFNIQYPFQYIDSGFAYLLVSFYCITALNVGFIFFLLYRLSYRYIRSSLSDCYSYFFFFWVSYFFLFCFIVLEIFISLSHISFVYFDESIPSRASCNLVLILEMVDFIHFLFCVQSILTSHLFALCPLLVCIYGLLICDVFSYLLWLV